MAIGRKVDPSPYYDWEALARAADLYEDIEHNFGIYPRCEIISRKESEVVASYKQGDKEDIQQIQRQLEELCYPVIHEDESNLGVFDKTTCDAVYSFSIRYMNKFITDDQEMLSLWHLVDHGDKTLNESARNELACWTQSHDNVMGDILDQY